MAESVLNNNKLDYQAHVDLNTCSDLKQIFDMLLSSNNGIGVGNVGNANNNNLKTLLGNPNIGAYTVCFITLEGFDNASNVIAKCVVGNVLASEGIKTKYLMKKQNDTYQQSSWV